MDDKTIDEYMERIIYGAPQVCDAYSSDKNFMAYYKYGNHKSVEKEEDEFRKTMIKDSKRGNTMLLDKDLTLFIPHLHLTPQGIVNVGNKYKSSRPVFDLSFQPEEFCKAIND